MCIWLLHWHQKDWQFKFRNLWIHPMKLKSISKTAFSFKINLLPFQCPYPWSLKNPSLTVCSLLTTGLIMVQLVENHLDRCWKKRVWIELKISLYPSRRMPISVSNRFIPKSDIFGKVHEQQSCWIYDGTRQGHPNIMRCRGLVYIHSPP